MSGSFLSSRTITCPHHGTPLLTWDFAHAGLPFWNTLPQVSSFRAQLKALLFVDPFPDLSPPPSTEVSSLYPHPLATITALIFFIVFCIYLAYLFVPTLIQSLVLRAVLGAGDTARNNLTHSLAQRTIIIRWKNSLFHSWICEGSRLELIKQCLSCEVS